MGWPAAGALRPDVGDARIVSLWQLVVEILGLASVERRFQMAVIALATAALLSWQRLRMRTKKAIKGVGCPAPVGAAPTHAPAAPAADVHSAARLALPSPLLGLLAAQQRSVERFAPPTLPVEGPGVEAPHVGSPSAAESEEGAEEGDDVVSALSDLPQQQPQPAAAESSEASLITPAFWDVFSKYFDGVAPDGSPVSRHPQSHHHHHQHMCRHRMQVP